MKLVLALVLSLLAFTANAQTVPGRADYAWTLPLTGCTVGVTPCDNKPLTGAAALTGVEVFVSTSPIPEEPTVAPTATISASGTTHAWAGPVANGSTLYARFRAVNAGQKGFMSPQVTKLIQLDIKPGAISNVTVTFQVQVSP
jgi:hypothetical protein